MKKLIIPILTLLMTASCGNTKSVNTNTWNPNRGTWCREWSWKPYLQGCDIKVAVKQSDPTITQDDLNKTTDRLYKELHKLLSETN